MRTKIIAFAAALFFYLPASSQGLLKVYHGARGESRVFDNVDAAIVKPTLKMNQGETLTIEIVNANTLLYNYSLKFESLTVESEDKAITDLLATFNTIIAARPGAFIAAGDKAATYPEALNSLTQDINQVKQHILQSDKPEQQEDALKLRHTAGLRKALDDISSLSAAQYHFNNSNLLDDLNKLIDSSNLSSTEKQAFKLLNSSLVEKVNDIKKQTDPHTIQTIWRNEFKVTDTPTKITLIINKIDKSNKILTRDGSGETEFNLELGTVVPYYKRAALELVPVANFIFSNNVREFYVDNNIVQNRFKSKITTTAGVVLNVNLVHFGPTKELSFGVGPGYKFNSVGDAFENIYLSTLLSYKNYIRMGFGFGFAQLPTDELKEGGKIGQPLPNNISNLDDLLIYREQPSVFLTLAFTGLNLSKKK